MSKPTPYEKLYAWHTNALRGVLADEPLEYNEEPECGWFQRRLVKDGPWVPARIWMYQPVDPDTGDLVGDEVFQCEVNGRHADPYTEFFGLSGHPISEAHFNYLTAAIAWSAEYAPDEPRANPYRPVDWLKVPPPTFTKEA